jgi:hypothetical protein
VKLEVALRFRRGWQSVIDDRSYADDTFGRLPVLPEERFVGDFAWLVEGAAGPDASYMTPNPSPGPLRRDLGFPGPFATFMASRKLQGRVPSCTGNAWELGERVVASPVEEHGLLIEFMHDQQGCWFWYLYLGPDGSCPVLGSAEQFDGGYDWTPDEFVESVSWEAPHFEHFLYRYWIENVAWWGGPAAHDYLAERNNPARVPLDVWPAPLRWSGDSPDQLTLW